MSVYIDRYYNTIMIRTDGVKGVILNKVCITINGVVVSDNTKS